MDSLPCYEVHSCTDIPSLQNIDPEVCLPSLTNFNYYSPHKFHSDINIQCSFTKDYFSALHWNLRSLQANFDSLTNLLYELNHTFSVIGISKTRLTLNKDQTINTRLENYQFISQPTLSNAGGVGLYINQKISFTLKNKHTTSTKDFEGLWIEIENNSVISILLLRKHIRTLVYLFVYISF